MTGSEPFYILRTMKRNTQKPAVMRSILLLMVLALVLASCHQGQSQGAPHDDGDTLKLKYAEHLTIVKHDGYTVVELKNPWKTGAVLHRYVLLATGKSAPDSAEATVVRVPLRRSIVFTTAHASLMEMLGCEESLAGVCDAQYMLLPWVQQKLRAGGLGDCGNGMAPDVEKIVDLHPDALFVSPFENSGGYGRLEEIGIPLIETADYMETSALGRAEWMKFYGLLFGREAQADSLFAAVESQYGRLKKLAADLKTRPSVIADRKTGSVWYMPGGRSSVGKLYRDAGAAYAFAADTHSGSLALPFETVLDKAGDADVWLLSYNGKMSLRTLGEEFSGYKALKAYQNGEVYGVAVDRTPYFEQVSWRPDLLLRDYIILFHHYNRLGRPRYYEKLSDR